MRPHDDNREDDERRTERDFSAWLPAFTLLPLVFLAFLGAAHMLHRDGLKPAVGDIVVFRPGAAEREMFQVMVPAARVNPAAGTGADCLLNSAVMGTAGGSLVVERRLPTDPPRFQLHWAGGPTAVGARDCGPAATLQVDRVDLRKLGTAAGGFGLGRKGWMP